MSETATPTGVVITATAPDGSTRNITEGVQVLYDLVIQSLDWGSGFLSVEEVTPMVALAEFCGFRGSEEAVDYLAREKLAEKQRKCSHPSWHEKPLERIHLSSLGRECVERVCDSCGYTRVDS